jgi:dsRNA-specific ribonuclease
VPQIPKEDDDHHYDGTDHTRFPPLEQLPPRATSLPSPPPERALQSAKLAALHARLSLPERLPLQTLARTLVDASADENPQFNNTNLAFVGQSLINYHVAEWLMCRYPRLPMIVMYAAMKGYAGPTSLHHVARSWGVEHAAVPGGEVDPGLLQFSMHKPGNAVVGFGYRRAEADGLKKHKWRHGMSSRVVFDDDFGEVVDTEDAKDELRLRADAEYGNEYTRSLAEKAYATCARAVTGAIYAHAGRERAKAFIEAHVLSRTLDLSKLFAFKKPTRELSLLCAREDFEPPVARLLSETGRLSRTPVYVVGIFSGKDKLGEAAGSSLEYARTGAAMNALKSWYLYSPGEGVRVPSDMLNEDAAPWEPAYIDMGEIIGH